MKSKILNTLLILTSLIGYLEWGNSQHMFLFEIEVDIIKKLFFDPMSVVHPFVILPISAQLFLIFTLVQKKVSKKLSYVGIFGLSILLGFMFIIGLMSFNYKIIFSSSPFMIIAVVISVLIMMAFSGPVGDFVNRHPSVQMLGLAFLIAIGFMLIAEGAHLANVSIFGSHIGSVPKGYLYFAIAFSLLVEVLNIKMQKNAKPVQLHDYKAQAEREGLLADNKSDSK